MSVRIVRPDILQLRLKALDAGSKTQRINRVLLFPPHPTPCFKMFVVTVRWEMLILSFPVFISKNIIILNKLNRRVQLNNWDPTPTARPRLSIQVGDIGRQALTIFLLQANFKPSPHPTTTNSLKRTTSGHQNVSTTWTAFRSTNALYAWKGLPLLRKQTIEVYEKYNNIICASRLVRQIHTKTQTVSTEVT